MDDGRWLSIVHRPSSIVHRPSSIVKHLTDIPTTTSPQKGSAARRVAANALNPFAAQIATKLLMLGYGIAQYRFIGGGKGHLGDYFLAALVFLYTSTISDWGLSTLLTREVAKDRGVEGEAERVALIFRQTLSLRIYISLALLLPVCLFVIVYAALFKLSPDGAWATIILTVALLPGAFSGSVTSLLFAYERMSLPAIIGIATSFMNVALGIASLLLGWGITGLATAASVTTLFTAIIFWRVLHRDFPGLRLNAAVLRISKRETIGLLKAGWPLMLNALLVGLFFRVDQFIIKANVGRRDGNMTAQEAERASSLAVERYQAAYSFLNFVLLITPAVTLALFPRMARHAANDRPRLAFEYTFALKALLILSVPIVLLTVWFAPLLITVVTGGKQNYLPDSAIALQILIFFLPFSFVNGVTQYVLIALDRQRLITRAFAATVVFNVAANLLLVPLLGINGAALTTVLSELVLLGPFLRWTGRELGGISIAQIALKPLVAGLVAGGLGWSLQGIAQRWSSGWMDMTLYSIAGLLLVVVYAGALLLERPFTETERTVLKGALRRRS